MHIIIIGIYVAGAIGLIAFGWALNSYFKHGGKLW